MRGGCLGTQRRRAHPYLGVDHGLEHALNRPDERSDVFDVHVHLFNDAIRCDPLGARQ